MQLDSDIIVNKYTIEKLIHFISKNNDEIAVAPILRPLIKKKYLKFFLTNQKFTHKWKITLKSGKITDIGYNSWFEKKLQMIIIMLNGFQVDVSYIKEKI